MFKLLRFSLYGVKNLENEVTLEFCGATTQDGIKKINNIKGIYGYNGAGKSAIVCAMNLYEKLVLKDSFLSERQVIEELDNLINYKRKELYISVTFEGYKEIIEHKIKIKKNDLLGKYVIFYEEVLLHKGRTLNEKGETIFLKSEDKLKSKYDLQGVSSEFNNLNYNSFVHELIINFVFLKYKGKIDDPRILHLTSLIISMARIYLFSMRLFVYLPNTDNYFYDYASVSAKINSLLKEDYKKDNKMKSNDEFLSLFQKQKYKIVVRKTVIEEVKKMTKKLEKFLKIFKPELKKIELEIVEDKENAYIGRIFVYDDYKVGLEYESAGIKQLVEIFPYLYNCANGGVTFIDEIDTYLNSVYFEKLISFFIEYGKGQLVFTAHNIEPMSELKNQLRAITILGVDNKIETFTKKGNYDPKNIYKKGYFPNLPMNVENFDFLNIFFEDEL